MGTITGKCAGNTASSEDVTCGANKLLKSNAASISSTAVAMCCDTVCSAHTCGNGKHLKGSASSIRGATDGLCCDTDITGKCSGNTVSSQDVTCGTNKFLKSSATAISGTNEAACCEASCGDFECGTGRTKVANPSSVAGSYDGVCCQSDPCDDFDCGATCVPAVSTGMVCQVGAAKKTAAYGSALTGFDYCASCCDITTASAGVATTATSFAANGAELSFVGLGAIWGLNF